MHIQELIVATKLLIYITYSYSSLLIIGVGLGRIELLTSKPHFNCFFQVDSFLYQKVLRKNIEYPFYGIEDIKYCFIKEKKIYCLSNILTKCLPKREFRVGIVSIDIENKKILLEKLLRKPKMRLIEKNWIFYTYNEKDYVITNFLPVLEVYELNEKFELLQVLAKRSKKNFKFLLINLHSNYRGLVLTGCQSIYPLNHDLYFICLKTKINGGIYEYRVGYYNPLHFLLYIVPKIWIRGPIYLNSLQKIDRKYYFCFGINDMTYKIQEIPFPGFQKEKLKHII